MSNSYYSVNYIINKAKFLCMVWIVASNACAKSNWNICRILLYKSVEYISEILHFKKNIIDHIT